MGKIIEFYNKLNVSLKIILPLYLGMLIRLPFVMKENVKLSIILGMIPFAIIYPLVRKKPEEFSESEKKLLDKRRTMDALYLISYMICMEIDLIMLKLFYEPAWLIWIFIMLILGLTSWVVSHYFYLMRAIHKELNTDKGE